MVDDPQTNAPVTAWIRAVEQGDHHATAELWTYCLPRLLRYSRRSLPEGLRRVMDEEDIALSAFKSFCLRANDGTLCDVSGRDDLWRLLFCIASRKADSYVRHETAKKRGGGKIRGDSVFVASGQSGVHSFAKATAGATYEQFSHECEQLLELLEDETLQAIAILRIEGYTVEEISTRIGFARRTVERKLSLIRETWRAMESNA